MSFSKLRFRPIYWNMKPVTLVTVCVLAMLTVQVSGNKALQDNKKLVAPGKRGLSKPNLVSGDVLREPRVGGYKTPVQDSAAISNPCVYKGRYVTVDLRKVANQFNGVHIPDPLGKYIYFLSICSPITCTISSSDRERLEISPDPEDDLGGAAGCQLVKDRYRFVKLGATQDSKFTFFNLTHFSITFSGGTTDNIMPPNGDTDAVYREMTVDFVGVNSCSNNATIEFTEEKHITLSGLPGTLINYIFTVKMRMDEPGLFTFNNDGAF